MENFVRFGQSIINLNHVANVLKDEAGTVWITMVYYRPGVPDGGDQPKRPATGVVSFAGDDAEKVWQYFARAGGKDWLAPPNPPPPARPTRLSHAERQDDPAMW